MYCAVFCRDKHQLCARQHASRHLHAPMHAPLLSWEQEVANFGNDEPAFTREERQTDDGLTPRRSRPRAEPLDGAGGRGSTLCVHVCIHVRQHLLQPVRAIQLLVSFECHVSERRTPSRSLALLSSSHLLSVCLSAQRRGDHAALPKRQRPARGQPLVPLVWCGQLPDQRLRGLPWCRAAAAAIAATAAYSRREYGLSRSPAQLPALAWHVEGCIRALLDRGCVCKRPK